MAQRQYTILGQSKMTYSKAILELTGWDKKKFETEKRKMRYRVKTFNELTGASLSPIEQLYYRERFNARREYYTSKGYEPLEYNELQKALFDIKTTQAKSQKTISAQYERLKDYTLYRYEGLAKSYSKASDIYEKLKNNEISVLEANEQLSKFADDMRVLRDDNREKWIEAHDITEQIGTPL